MMVRNNLQDKKGQSEFSGIRGLKRKQVRLSGDWYGQEEG